jgi:PAT family beta-lactamase induction signal transducer AmpG
MAVLFLFGFSGGLPYLLTGQTLQAWMQQVGLDLGGIASLNAIALAYTLKVLWSPLLDRIRLPFLGRRRGWLLTLQLALMVAIAAMGAVDPRANPMLLVAIAIAVAFLSASQDVVIDAYNADILAPEQRAAGSAMYVLGYRVALVVTGTVAWILADHFPWRVIYAAMGGLMIIGVIATLFAEEPAEPANVPRTLTAALIEPIAEMFRRLGARGFMLMIAFAALYRFGDYFAQALIIPFFRSAGGFSYSDIAVVNKAVGFAGMALGGLAAGTLVARFGLRKMLVGFGVLAAITNLLYMWLAFVHHDMTVFCIAVFVDNVSTALGTAAFVSVLMSACSPAVSATQFALLTSLSSIGRNVFGPFASNVVEAVGWHGFFIATALMAIPGLGLAWLVAHKFAPREQGS